VVARYKDLVRMGNGISRASLAVDDRQRAAGPLERNVLKNFLAFRLSETLEQAGDALSSGERVLAAERLASFQDLLEGLRIEMPGLESDLELAADIAMLAEYRTVLASAAADRPEHLAYLSDSLRYAGRLKLLAPPSSN
jgi:hypothetical protein